MPSSSARASDHDEPLTEEDSLPLLPIGTKGQAGLAPLDELAPAEQGLASEFAVQQGYRESEGAGQTAKGVIGWLIWLDIVPTHMDSIGLALALGGLGLFVPITWYLLLVGDLSAQSWFTFHPILASLGIAFMILGITPLQPPPPAKQGKEVRAARLDNHQTLLLYASLPVLLASYGAIWWNKEVHAKAHLQSWHGWLGAASVMWFLANAGMGASSVWWKGKLMGGEAAAKQMYKYHRLSGYLLVSLMLLTAFLGGARSGWAKRNDHTIAKILAYWIALPMLWVGLGIRIRGSKMKMI